jgi:general secretion pathway protein A
MYQTHWGLSESPFRSCLDPDFFHASPTHEEALARLHWLVDERRRLGLLLGVSGSGKSLLMELFAHQLRRAGCPVAGMSLVAVGPVEFLCLVAEGLGLYPRREESIPKLWRMVTDRIAELRYQQTPTVLLLDDADEAPGPVLAQLTRLARHDFSPESWLTMALAGEPERIGHVGRQLLELAELRIDIEPWNAVETAAYLTSRLEKAGRRDLTFAEAAAARLHELSEGVPRRINQLADLSLLAGAGRELGQIDTETVESVYHELGVIEA